MNHTILHFEIPADDSGKLKQFYENVFGWKIERSPGPVEYWSITTVPVDEQGRPTEMGVNGGMMKMQNPEHKLTSYISVESVDEYAKKIANAGGKIIVPKQSRRWATGRCSPILTVTCSRYLRKIRELSNFLFLGRSISEPSSSQVP